MEDGTVSGLNTVDWVLSVIFILLLFWLDEFYSCGWLSFELFRPVHLRSIW